MNEATCEDIPEGQRHWDLDLLVEHWFCIAATAYYGFLLKGRGVVVVQTGKNEICVSYQPAAPCECHEALVAGYDPSVSAVVALDDDLYHLSGYPTPAEAYETADAELIGAAVH